MSDEGFLVTMRHVRAAKLCTRGAREWCARNGFSHAELVNPGLPVAALRALNDALANRVIAAAERERDSEHGR